jgi:hypothetical protein
MCRTLGATDPYFDAAATTLHYPFHEIEETVHEQAFEQQNLSGTARGRAIAQTLQVCAQASLPGMRPFCISRHSTSFKLQSLLSLTAIHISTLQQSSIISSSSISFHSNMTTHK